MRAKMDELSRFFPAGIEYAIPYDTSPFVEVSIEKVLHTLIEAVVLVFLVMFLFLQNFRYTIIPTLVVPVALLGTCAVMLVAGFSINVLTMFAMVLAIGILVDDAIVVVENVERIMAEEGLSPREATRKAMRQITGAIIGITLVLTAVFVPMAFFPGAVGIIYQQFSLTMVVSILFSGFLALSLTPALCATLPEAGHGGSSREARLLRLVQSRLRPDLARHTRQVVGRIVRRAGRFMVIYLALLAGLGWAYLQPAVRPSCRTRTRASSSSTCRPRRKRAATGRWTSPEQVEEIFAGEDAVDQTRLASTASASPAPARMRRSPS